MTQNLLYEMFDRRVAWAREHRVQTGQNREELLELFRLMWDLQPRRFLEIGSLQGGSLYILAGACAKDATVISVDAGTLIPLPGMRNALQSERKLSKVVEYLKAEGFNAHLILADSHQPSTYASVLALTKGGIDALFVDGDPSLEGTTEDLRVYGRLVRPGGLICIHGVASRRQRLKGLWRRLARDNWSRLVVGDKTKRLWGKRMKSITGTGILQVADGGIRL